MWHETATLEFRQAIGVAVDFTDISISPVPEPGSLAWLGLAVPAWWLFRRRQSTRG